MYFYVVGYYVIERGGIRVLSEWLNENIDFDVIFIDIFNFV